MKYDFTFLPLGGIGEIGSNCYILDFAGDSFLVDCGLTFCENLYPGVFASIPDIESIKDIKSKLKGIIITHGHDDHIGALPYFIESFDVPLYLSSFAYELLLNKLKEMGRKKPEKINILKGKKKEYLIEGKKFVFFKTYHSIPESYGFYVSTKSGDIIFTSDFKHFDFSILPSNSFILFVDATNAELTQDITEIEVRKTIDRIIKNTEGVFIASTFSSNLDRIKSLVKLIEKNNRKLFVTGKSILTTIEIAKKLKIVKNLEIFPWEMINKIPRNEVAIITTGTQGERFSSLKLMSQGMFRGFKLQKGDSVVISSRMIPGNERNIYGMINQFLGVGVDVYYAEISKTHCSGHGTARELKRLIESKKAKYLIPIHGEMRHLKALKDLAVKLGYNQENVIILEKGIKLLVKDGRISLSQKENIKRFFLDSHDNSIVTEELAKERRKLGEEGLVHVKLSFYPFVNVTFEEAGFKINDKIREALVEEIRRYLVYEDKDFKDVKLENLKQLIKNIIKREHKRKPFIIITKEQDNV